MLSCAPVQVICNVACANKEDVDIAVAAASVRREMGQMVVCVCLHCGGVLCVTGAECLPQRGVGQDECSGQRKDHVQVGVAVTIT